MLRIAYGHAKFSNICCLFVFGLKMVFFFVLFFTTYFFHFIIFFFHSLYNVPAICIWTNFMQFGVMLDPIVVTKLVAPIKIRQNFKNLLSISLLLDNLVPQASSTREKKTRGFFFRKIGDFLENRVFFSLVWTRPQYTLYIKK